MIRHEITTEIIRRVIKSPTAFY